MRDCFTFYRSFYEGVKELDDKTFRRLMTALMEYALNGEETELSGLENTVFQSWKANVNASHKRRDDGSRGGRPPKNHSETEEKGGFENKNHGFDFEKGGFDFEKGGIESENLTRVQKENENVNVNEKENTPPTPSKGARDREADELFETLWKQYPRKEGKGQVKSAQRRKLLEIGLDEMSRCIDRYKEAKKDTDPQYILHGSTFFNSGYVDYLDENYAIPEGPMPFWDESPPERSRQMTPEEFEAWEPPMVDFGEEDTG